MDGEKPITVIQPTTLGAEELLLLLGDLENRVVESENRLSNYEKEIDDLHRKVDAKTSTTDKINSLRLLLEAQNVVDNEGLPGSETKYIAVFNEKAMEKIRKKIFELMEKL